MVISIYVFSFWPGGFAPRPNLNQGSAPEPRWGTSVTPQSPCFVLLRNKFLATPLLTTLHNDYVYS